MTAIALMTHLISSSKVVSQPFFAMARIFRLMATLSSAIDCGFFSSMLSFKSPLIFISGGSDRVNAETIWIRGVY